MDQESFQVMQLFYTSLISRGIFTIGIFFMAWVAMRVGRTVGENPNIGQNYLSSFFSSAVALVVNSLTEHGYMEINAIARLSQLEEYY